MLYYGADCRETLRGLPEQSVHTVVTSPPYWGLRDYGTGDAQIGLEDSPDEFVTQLVEVFREVRRVLRDDGTLWLNLGDSYAQAKGQGHWESQGGNGDEKGQKVAQRWAKMDAEDIGLKPKDLVGIPWMVAFALRADGWYLRSDIIWAKGSCMPESVRDRPTKAHEYLFLFSKQPRYFYDAMAIKEPATRGTAGSYFNKGKTAVNMLRTQEGYRDSGGVRNKRTVWNVNPRPYPGAHFAVFPPDLIIPCVLAGTSEKGCCPKCGAPWERVVEKPTKPAERDNVRSSERDGGLTVEQGMERSGMSHFKYNEWLKKNPARTTDWKPTCDCNSGDPVPCTVLDPFSGSATTGRVALDRGRAYIGTDLNADYLELARARLLGERPPKITDNEDDGILEFFE
jgi:DNA modification methylase